MHFLVTNDDGVDSSFLREFIRALLAAGHRLSIVAPKHEQSWIGAAKSRHRPVHAMSADRGFGCPTWIVDGTPSDCINIALGHLLTNHSASDKERSDESANSQVDGVLSGINIGMNASLGFVIASGTIAGAWEGALHGLPSIAFSQDLTGELFDRVGVATGALEAPLLELVKTSARHAARLAPELITATPARSFIVHNVNFPLSCRTDTAVRQTVPARVVVPGLFGPAADDGTHRLVFRLGDDHSPREPLTDRAALAEGFISHTVLDYTRLGVV
ncbi:MAG TPA: 5'/3'-nucleotidase SurE [Opitutus sp.]|nr:5'/3'-nucleotidase SurE [Opitutus sp.]